MQFKFLLKFPRVKVFISTEFVSFRFYKEHLIDDRKEQKRGRVETSNEEI